MAALTITGGGFSLSFLTASGLDDLFLFKLPIVVEEPLETEGVNGRRWRTKFEQMEPTTLETTAEATNFATAVGLAQNHRSLVGSLVWMTWSAGGSTYTYRDAHVAKVLARPSSGSIIGGGASGSATAFVRTTWIIEPTDFHVFAN